MAQGPHPVEAAREALDVAARLFSGEPAIGGEVFARQAEGGEKLGDLSERELLRRSTRDLLVLQILLGQAACRCGVFLVREKAAETAVLLRALSAATRAASRARGRVREWPEHPEPGPQ